jgi:hypothetical protein
MELVKELTDVSRPGDGNRAVRKAIDRQHTAGASRRAKTIKLADVIDNCQDICRHDPRFGRVYIGEMRALMEVLGEGDRSLFEKASRIMAECAAKIGVKPIPPGNPGNGIKDFVAGSSPMARQHGIRLFTEAFSARDIMEPIPSFDLESLPNLYRSESAPMDLPVFGIRTNGMVTGYLTKDDFASGPPWETRPFEERQVAEFEASLADVIHILTHFTFCFVSFENTIIGVICRSDIEKPVVRMWLFGIIILIEMLAVEQVRIKWPKGEWASIISEGRMQKALLLQGERERRGMKADLVDCLQFSDKLQLVLQDPEFVENAGFNSSAAARKAMKDLESLRNNLAHGQDITCHDWPPIIRLAHRIRQLYGM